MDTRPIGARFYHYQQYRDIVDAAKASIAAPLSGGMPSDAFAQESIEKKRLFYVQTPDQLLIFHAYVSFYKLFYIAGESAALAVPQTDTPVLLNHVIHGMQGDPETDALMRRSGFRCRQVRIGLERDLHTPIHRDAYVEDTLPVYTMVGEAVPGEVFSIAKLLQAAYDPVLGELPGRSQLLKRINHLDVLVIRDHAKMAAVGIAVPNNNELELRWTAVDARYRELKLDGLIHYYQDIDACERGFEKSIIWIDGDAPDTLRQMQQRGYICMGQTMYSYLYSV